MSFSSIAAMLSAAQTNGQPLHAVIRDADCQENGYDAAASHRQIAALWTAMQQSSRQYCAADRSNSGLIGGDAARLRAAAESGRLLGGTYFQRVTEEALKVAECNACMKRIVAAPTAGLHFTEELLEKIREKGVEIGYVTLHVGLGTFRPVKVDDPTKHKMHSEYYILPQQTVDMINRTKARGGKVTAVGTTSVRVLETAGRSLPLKAQSGETDIFIYPGFEFHVIDRLITNFHLPESTLIMLVSALVDRETILAAYAEAVREKYRFFSFGDAMFIY